MATSEQGRTDDLVPTWGHKLTVPCRACGLPTHRHRSMDYDGVNIYWPQAGAAPVSASEGEEPDKEVAWIALMPGDYPAWYFADDEVYHLAGGIAWPGPHHRDYGTAKVAHDVCCPGRHHRRSEADAREYLTRLWHGPDATSAYRLVYAFTDHSVVRVWGTPAPCRQVDL